MGGMKRGRGKYLAHKPDKLQQKQPIPMKRSPKQRAAMTHNSLIGLAVAIQKNADTIARAPTSDGHSIALATLTRDYAKSLEQALRAERKDT